MAELTKKLHFLKGVEQTAKAYSTVDEAGDNYITNKIDGVTCYIPLGAVDDSQATCGRVTKSGTTYAIKQEAKPPYAEESWTTAGTYTWTAPAGVSRIRVAVCGGGGGASYEMWDAGGGGTSKFGDLIQATGGNAGSIGDDGDPDSSGNYEYGYGGKGGTPNGRDGYGHSYHPDCHKYEIIYGGSGFGLSFDMTDGTYGQGGSLQTKERYASGLGTGGSGGYNSAYIDVVAGSTYSIVVGGAGFNRSFGAINYNDPASGFVLIAYGGDI